MFRTNQDCSWRVAAAVVLFFVVASVNQRADAFASTSSTPSHSGLLAGARPITAYTSSSSQLQFFSGYEMGGADAVNTKKDSDANADKEAPSTVEMEDPLLVVALVTKMAIILIIKTAKDVVNYPPNLLDQYNRNQQIRNQEIAAGLKTEVVTPVTLMAAEETAAQSMSTITSCRDTSSDSDTSSILPLELTKANPFILLAKLIGVLAYKTLHDSIYYPALWINDSLYPSRNDDNYNYY